ncbi:glycosyltransferase family 4 protein [Acuticoccus mangrovi]|uniref:Glycosyltransferase family 4 protein n=1 Tax=Acuticoccus mangrovi TaxID=2796142 RepID=A0A934IR80_9HYPH|nr:glycosyltransferase family 4 protein [Acuticoccus mangrovi]MBJ3777158.1 glycosyltransferase family 4 protein [Acuticoccus mangrovi]
MAKGRIAVVVKGYPRLSETFIAQEILGLERLGLDLLIVSLRKPYDGAVHALHREISAPVLYLPEYLKDDPARVRAGRNVAARLPGYAEAEAIYAADLARDPSASRRRRWGQAAVLAAELPGDIAMIYVHFLHTPASVARYAATMRGLPFAFSAHAKDIYTTPDWEIAEKIAAAEWGVTCTAANVARLRALADRPDKVTLGYHGLDLSRFPAPPERTGAGPVRFLSVCRAVEKKGLDDLLRALAKLPADLDWRFEHVGGGGLVARLEKLAERLGIADRVTFSGAMAQDGVIEAYRRADVFVLASRVAKNGDRDGLPNVIMEAMALGLPVVSTRVSAVPEIVTEETGILVEQRDPAALADAMARVGGDPALRARLAEAGISRVKTRFSPMPTLELLASRLSGDDEPAHRAA